MKKLTIILIGLLAFSTWMMKAQTVEATLINLNTASQYGGDYPTDNNNYSNVLTIGGVGAEVGLKIFKQSSGSSPTFIGPSNYNDTYLFEMTDGNGSDPDGGIIFGGTGNDDVFENILTIRGNKKVGIGTTNPYYKLDVEGTIRAHEIKVNLNAGADFVFDEDYNLMPLNELETFVKTQKHLPEVAPAKEMEAEGLSLSEMNIKLLQKIEELTLYTIEQQKTIDKLMKNCDSQNEMIKEQNKRIQKLENNK